LIWIKEPLYEYDRTRPFRRTNVKSARTLAVCLLVAIPSLVFAKANTSKIIIKGSDRKSIEITDAKLLGNFRVWAGPGTSSDDAKSLIVDWSRGRVAEAPQGLQRYEVDFYAKLPDERLIYVVFCQYDPSTAQGYVYIPGKADEGYWLDVGTILHGVEGNWFHAWSAWDEIAGPLVTTVK